MTRALRVVPVLCGALLWSCQSILGFEELQAEVEGAGADDDVPGTDPTDDAGAATDDDDTAEDASPAGGESAGGGTEGVPCGGADPCDASLTCSYGFCRRPCADDTECAQGRECLYADGRGGCRLGSETCEDAQDCANADLVCGLDGVCRVDCSTRSCDAPTQRCIAGTCVSTVGERAGDWDCGAAADGDVVCTGSQLQACNVNAPGLADVEDCGNAAVCLASVPADGRYDPSDAPSCKPACAAGSRYCEGSTLLACDEDGAGPVDEGEACATAPLCEGSVATESPSCLDPACAVDEVRCAGGQTELIVQACNDGRTGFDERALCQGSTRQCNPGASACFDLDIDATEVSMDAYASWLGTNPDLATQPNGCAWNDAFEPEPDCLNDPSVAHDGAQPQVCIDWCDAYAYCAGVGRRLCGRIAGGMNDFDAVDDASSSQWMNACSAGGQYEWGSGAAPTPDPIGCVHSGSQVTTPYAVGSHANCSSPSPSYEHVRDLSGNVEEWEDSCEHEAASAPASASDACRTRGGSFDTTRDETRCDAVPASAKLRSSVAPTLGFRCCG